MHNARAWPRNPGDPPGVPASRQHCTATWHFRHNRERLSLLCLPGCVAERAPLRESPATRR
eukprot:186302-Alexandrium_andersonii.AAC.1